MNVFNYTKGDNPNTLALTFSWLTVYYSYTTPIMFICRLNGSSLICMRDYSQSTTTAKHKSAARKHANVNWDKIRYLDDVPFDSILAVIEKLLKDYNTEDLADELAAMMGDDEAAQRT